MYTAIKTALQLAFFGVLSLFSNFLAEYFELSLPGSIIGIFILFLLLQLKIIDIKWIESGANFLLAELLLFFIPSAVGIIKYQSLLLNEGLSIILVIMLGTVIVMAASGLPAKKIARTRSKEFIS